MMIVRVLSHRRLCGVAAVLLLAGLLHAAGEIAPGDVQRLDWVEIIQQGGGGCCIFPGSPITRSVRVVDNTASPCGASALYGLEICLVALGGHGTIGHHEFSTQFRPNGDDSLIFTGLTSSFLTGYHSTEQLRTIMARKPIAAAKLGEFDQGATAGGVMRACEYSGYLLGLAGLISGAIIQSKNEATGNALLYGGLGCVGLGIVLGPTGEFVNCSAFRKLHDAVASYNALEQK